MMPFFNTKLFNLQRVSPSPYLEIDVETTLSYYIIDSGLDISMHSLEYKLSKVSGRNLTQLIAWTTLDIAGITDDTYDISLTLTGVTTTDNLQLLIRCTDTDGAEYYHKDTEVSPI